MSIFSSIKKALGFPDDYEEDLDDLADLEDPDDSERAESTNDTDDDKTSATISESSDSTIPASSSPEQVEIQEIKPTSTPPQTPSRAEQKLSTLEQHIAELEAEREQLRLENKCMIDKLRGHTSPMLHQSHINNSEHNKLTDECQSLRQELTLTKRKLVQTESELSQLKEATDENDSAKSKLADMQAIIDDLNTKCDEKELLVEQLRSLNSQLTDRLNLAEAKADEERAKSVEHEQEIERLNQTIRTNLDDHARTTTELHDEIKRLSSLIQAADIPEPMPQNKQQETSTTILMRPAKRRKKRNLGAQLPLERCESEVKISAIDELMDNTDWFIAAEPGPRPKDPETEENFGYKEPTKKIIHKGNDKNQLTLF